MPDHDFTAALDAERQARAQALGHARILEAKDAEIARLRAHLHRHFAFARFVHLWTNRDNVTDEERVSVIKHHPFLAECMGETEQIR